MYHTYSVYMFNYNYTFLMEYIYTNNDKSYSRTLAGIFCLKCLMNTVLYEITLYQPQAEFVLTDSTVLHILLVLILR